MRPTTSPTRRQFLKSAGPFIVAASTLGRAGAVAPNSKVRLACLHTTRILMYRIADPGPGFNIDTLPNAAISYPDSNAVAVGFPSIISSRRALRAH